MVLRFQPVHKHTGKQAFRLQQLDLKNMQQLAKSYLSVLHHPSLSHALTAFTSISQLKQTHAQLIVSNNINNVFTAARILACAAIPHFSDMLYAQTIFEHFHNPTLFMYNTIYRGFSQQPKTPLFLSLSFYLNMLRSGISPDNFTFPFLLRSSSFSSHLYPYLGHQIHAHVFKYGFHSDVFVLNNAISFFINCGQLDYARKLFDESLHLVDAVSWTTLITGYSNSGDIVTARHFFNQMPCKNTVSWNAIISVYARAGHFQEALLLFDSMPEKDVASWSAVISGYSLCGMNRDALFFFKKMVVKGIIPNEASLVSAVSSCAQLRSLEEGVWLHDYIVALQFEINVTLGTAIVNMYGKCGNVEKAILVFNSMEEKNVITWNSMIAGLAYNGFGKQALSLFWRMQMLGPAPNGPTFIAALSGCSHSGLVDEGCKIFSLMINEYEIKPQLQHYGCIVDLLGRAGLIEEAMTFVEKMPVEPHPGLLGSLAGACRLHGDVEVGKNIGTRLIELEPNQGGRYALLSNIFAVVNRWDDMALVSNMLKERRVLKTRGYSMQF